MMHALRFSGSLFFFLHDYFQTVYLSECGCIFYLIGGIGQTTLAFGLDRFHTESCLVICRDAPLVNCIR
jgi:hypothetical protein